MCVVGAVKWVLNDVDGSGKIKTIINSHDGVEEHRTLNTEGSVNGQCGHQGIGGGHKEVGML